MQCGPAGTRPTDATSADVNVSAVRDQQQRRFNLTPEKCGVKWCDLQRMSGKRVDVSTTLQKQPGRLQMTVMCGQTQRRKSFERICIHPVRIFGKKFDDAIGV